MDLLRTGVVFRETLLLTVRLGDEPETRRPDLRNLAR
jgi:hypothetical protein